MPKFNVHLYREMRLLFPEIEAENAEQAAKLAADMFASEAIEVEDCEGVNLGATVDVVGDTEYEQSCCINFPVRVAEAGNVVGTV